MESEFKKLEGTLSESEEYARIFGSYQHAILELRQFYVTEASFEQMLQKTVDLYVKDFGYYMAWYGQLKEEEKVIIPQVWAGRGEEYLDGLRLKLDDSEDAKCAMSLAIVRKEPFGYADLEHDKDFEKWRPLALKYGYRSNQAIPLVIGGKCIGAFLIYSTRTRAFSQILISYLAGIANELATIVEKITERQQAEEKLKKYREHLEEMIEERTAELKTINAQLKREITERQQAEEKLKEAQARLIQSEKLASIGQLAQGVAHEINNPLTAILGEAEILLRDKDKDKDTKDAAKTIVEQGERIKRITQRLLEFSLKKDFAKIPVDINYAVNKSITLLSYQAKIEEIEIVKKLNPRLPEIFGDKDLIQEVFLNIMLNAVQAMKKRGMLKITTRCEKITKFGRRATDIFKYGERIVVIEFKDTGEGMDEETLKSLFVPFFTTKKDSTGLGLSICYGIIRNHNGIIEVESKLGKGSTFIVKLPALKERGE